MAGASLLSPWVDVVAMGSIEGPYPGESTRERLGSARAVPAASRDSRHMATSRASAGKRYWRQSTSPSGQVGCHRGQKSTRGNEGGAPSVSSFSWGK